MARDASTYRGSRRNACLRERPKSTWGPHWYYAGHNKDAHSYVPAMRQKPKRRIDPIREMYKGGGYADTVRGKVGGVKTERTRASGRGD